MTSDKGADAPGFQFLHEQALKAIQAGNQRRIAIGWLVAMRLCALLIPEERESGDG